MEGPFLNDTSKARSRTVCENPSLDAYARIVDGYAARPRVITGAPESAGATELIGILKSSVAVSAGHTDATAEQFEAAVDAGITQVTHLFNAMSPFTHRAPGVAGARFRTSACACS
jgi:N-acetylglucosamine-6-phosphate deacetylase